MRIKFRDKNNLTIDEQLLVRSNDKRQVMPADINEHVALDMFKGLKWCKVLETPSMFYFRE